MQVLRGNNLPLRSCKLLLLLRQFRVGNQQQNAMRLVGQDAAWVVEGNFRPGCFGAVSYTHLTLPTTSRV